MRGKVPAGGGSLRLLAILQAPQSVPDGTGGAGETWLEVGRLSVSVEPLRVWSGERFDARSAEATHRVLCRFRAGVERGMRLRLGARSLSVLTVHDPEERGRFLELSCREDS